MNKITSNKERGYLGENIAQRYLIANGYKIVMTNSVNGAFEIDIIARDPMNSDFVFIEVKTSMNTLRRSAFSPSDRVDWKKIARIKISGQKYLAKIGELEQAWRIDVISILINPQTKTAKLKHFKNI